VLIGYVAGTLTIASGGKAFLIGMMESLVVEPGGKAKLRGLCKGDVRNDGGDLTVLRGAVIDGTLHGREHTRVDPGARISNSSSGLGVEEVVGAFPENEAVALTHAVIDDYQHGRWASITQHFDETMRAELTEKELARGWARLAKRLGALKGHGETTVARNRELTRTITPLIFERGGHPVARVAIRDDGTIAGLYIVEDHSAARSGSDAT